MLKINSVIKDACKLLYRTRIGDRLWRGILQSLHRPFIKKVFLAALYQSGLGGEITKKTSDKIATNYDLQLLALKKHALVIIPWWGQDATCTNIRSLSLSLKKLGYVIHVIHFNDYPFGGNDDCFDKVYSVFPLKKNARKWQLHDSAEVLSQNKIDDWVDGHLTESVLKLNKVFNFELCLCNYPFLSLSLESLPETTLKILYTHDIFSFRNEKLKENGIGSKFYDFSCTPAEEMKAFKRADCVVAVQKKDEEYLRKQGLVNVITIPYVPEEQKVAKSIKRKKLTIGYMASSHRPNVVAISHFISFLSTFYSENKNFELHIAGSICDSLDSLPEFVKLIGRVGAVKDFYKEVDLLINPDCVPSGIKIKCIEALSFGIPLVCTRYAMIGVDTNCEYHLCEDVRDCVVKVISIIENPSILLGLANESKTVYGNFQNRYDPMKQFSKVISDFKAKSVSSPKGYDSLKPKVSIIIPVCAKSPVLNLLFQSIFHQTEKRIEILPKFYCSSQNVEWIKSVAKQDARVVFDPVEYPSFGTLLDSAINSSKADRLLVLNGFDMILDDNALMNMLDHSVDVVGCSLELHKDFGLPEIIKIYESDNAGKDDLNFCESSGINFTNVTLGNFVIRSTLLRQNLTKDLEGKDYIECLDLIRSLVLSRQITMKIVNEVYYSFDLDGLKNCYFK